MAQISKGIKIGYAVALATRTLPLVYTYIPELTGIPSLGSAPSTHQVTTLDNASHVYIKGLADIGGNLEFPCMFTKEIIDIVDTAVLAEASGEAHEWAVEFPAPLAKRAYFTGEASLVYNDSADIDAPLVGTLALTPSSDILWEDVV